MRCAGLVVSVHLAATALAQAGPAAPPLGEVAAHTPAALEAIYGVDPSRGAGLTVATVDAFAYPALEADLAAYRAMFDLPACTTASGCLRIVNLAGAPAPLPTFANADWELETALDVDMISAGCPACRILVVQVDEPDDDLDAAQAVAARLGADTITNSWGAAEGSDAAREPMFTQVGVGIFAASGDQGFAAGPQYPATSLHVIAVGGTRVVDGPLARTTTAWAEAGSSCSTELAAPAFQPAEASAACAMRAASDVAADADPATGVAVYCSPAGGLTMAGGTSAAAPFVAALMAGAGHPDADAAFVYRHAAAFTDVTAGSNGSCATTLCQAGSGWDGPTGLGSPDQGALVAIGGGVGPAVAITAPADGATVAGAFTVAATVGSGAAHVDLAIDGVRVVGLAAAPYAFGAPALAAGAHVITVQSYTADHDVGRAQITITATAPAADGAVSSPDAGAGGSDSGGGCDVTGSAPGGGGAIAILAASLARGRIRRRRVAALRLP